MSLQMVNPDAGRTKAGKKFAEFICGCGCRFRAVLSNVKSGNTTNCGCVRRTKLVGRNTRHGSGARGERTPEYSAWVGMWARVSAKPGTRAHRYYGALGVTACDKWRDFCAFLSDVGAMPSPGLTLDRINPHGNYEPGNVRWATWSQQRKNRRTS